MAYFSFDGYDYIFSCFDCEVFLMPVGDPKPQTIATKKYEKKAGWMSKSYKLRKEIVESFAEACEKAGVSQASQISTMMKEFIELQRKK